MKINSAALILGGALLLTSAPVLAADQTQAGPIQIDHVTVYPINNGSSSELVVTPGSVNIAFTNERNVPATRVAFVLLSGGAIIDRTDDVGTFSQGTTINFTFPAEQYKAIRRAAVAQATFADGTVWHNPNVPAEQAAAPIPGVAVVSGY